MCVSQMKRRSRGSDNNAHLDKLRFSEPHSCYETDSVLEGGVKRALDHPIETVSVTVRHCQQPNDRTISIHS